MRAFLIVFAVVALASVAYGQDFVMLYGLGTGDFMDSPVVFTGAMDAGGDITAGSWSITVDDTGWPTEPTARYQYIWDTFYAPNYDYVPGGPSFWKGYFDKDHGLSELNALTIVDDTNGGTMSGVCSIEIQVQDGDNDGELDEGEFCSGSLAGIVIIIRNGTGVYEGMCGDGNYFGSYVKDCPLTSESWNYGMYLWLEDCTTGTDESTWGSIKALYQ